MYYLRNGAGEFAPGLGKWLDLAFSVFGGVAAFDIGDAVQVNSMAAVLGESFSVPSWVTGLVVTALVGLAVNGGTRCIGEVAGKLDPQRLAAAWRLRVRLSIKERALVSWIWID